ncbi:MAG: DUF4091 domain-containing protein [Clostridia bacterium]|nr:DUF4091 domain-containing protein [Clostridia bacterium]
MNRHTVKHIVKTALLLLLCPLIASCQAGDGANPSDSADTSALTETAVQSEKEESSMNNPAVWIVNGFDKITEDTEAPVSPVLTYDLYMAKNEAESCQISMRSDKRIGSFALTCTEEAENGPTLDLFREDTVPTGKTDTPDGLSPFSGKLTLLADRSSTVLLRFTADKETEAGTYTYHFTAGGEGGTVCTVNVHVWDFALPDEPGCETAVGLYKHCIAGVHGTWDEEELDALYKAYYDLLLEYKVTAYDLPYDILDERADAYMSDARVTSFRVPTCDGDDARLVQIYEKLCSNPIWLKKAYFYPLDEPTSKEMLDNLASLCERLHTLAPEVSICTPFFLNIDYNSSTDQISFMTGKTTLWCPKSYMYITSNVYSAAQLEKYPSFGERMAERKAAGDRVWWYVCWEPGDPYNNLFVDQRGVQHRILFWQQYANDVDGFLYWGANYWNSETGTTDPWSDMATVKNLSPDVYGDGSLLYNGNVVGVDGACPSLRLEAVRDGVEDNALLKLAESLLGREWVDEKIAEITPSLTKYSTDSNRFITVRNEICAAVEAALKQN